MNDRNEGPNSDELSERLKARLQADALRIVERAYNQSQSRQQQCTIVRGLALYHQTLSMLLMHTAEQLKEED